MTDRAPQLAALVVAAARRVELFEAALASADAASTRAATARRVSTTRFRRRDTAREDAARARAVASAGLDRARRVQAAAAEELGRLLGCPGEAVPVYEGLGAASRGRADEAADKIRAQR